MSKNKQITIGAIVGFSGLNLAVLGFTLAVTNDPRTIAEVSAVVWGAVFVFFGSIVVTKSR